MNYHDTHHNVAPIDQKYPIARMEEAAKSESDEVSSNAEETPRRPSQAVPLQKRRRVTRACDECRRKKIKCDGAQPCTHCTVYSYECTYDQPSQRRRNPGPAYVEALENKLQKAEAILKTFDPNINLNSLDLNDTVSKGQVATDSQRSSFSQDGAHARPASKSDDTIESMVKATGQLDLDERGRWEYYGNSAGLTWLRRIRDQFGESSGAESRSRDLHRGRNIGQDFESPVTPAEERKTSPFGHKDEHGSSIRLPSRKKARRLCTSALSDATAILNICHQPSFYCSFDRIYGRTPDTFEQEDNQFLPLLYAVLALGSLFDKSEEGELGKDGYVSATHSGYEYFWAARNIMDLTDCRDMVSLQAIIFMIMFLQCSAKLSTCYSYIGIALRAALRMGLHRAFRDSFTPIEAETRKRAFWVIRKFDIYVGAMLGLPLTLSDDDIDQDLPSEVDDDQITEAELVPSPSDHINFATAANANLRLAQILRKIVKSIYPTKGFQNQEEPSSRSYSVPLSTIRELENDLQKWMEGLPPSLKPGGKRIPGHGPVQQLLRHAYAHAQMMLYRPFLHYVSSRQDPTQVKVDQRSYACAAACISVARNIIHLTVEMMKEGFLVGSYWFTMYTTFFAVLSLLYFAVENADSATAHEILRDATAGRDVLAQLAKRSMAADRCTKTLNNLWSSLPEKLANSDLHSKPVTRKRQASTTKKASSNDNQSMPPPPLPATSQRPRASTRQSSQQVAQQNNRPPIFERRAVTQGSKLHMPSASTSGSSSSSGSGNTGQPIDPQQATMMQQAHLQLQQHQHLQRQQSFQDQQLMQQQLPQRHVLEPQQPFAYGNLQHPSNLNQLSNLMFPSADPFAYPVPPMTTLEQNAGWGTPQGSAPPPLDRRTSGQPAHMHDHRTQHPNSHHVNNQGHNWIPASTAGADTVNADDHIDVQLFGPLPPYLMPGYVTSHQQQQQQQQQQHQQQHQNHGQYPQGPQQMRPDQQGGIWNQINMEGFGYDDIFGDDEEWRGSLM